MERSTLLLKFMNDYAHLRYISDKGAMVSLGVQQIKNA